MVEEEEVADMVEVDHQHQGVEEDQEDHTQLRKRFIQVIIHPSKLRMELVEQQFHYIHIIDPLDFTGQLVTIQLTI